MIHIQNENEKGLNNSATLEKCYQCGNVNSNSGCLMDDTYERKLIVKFFNSSDMSKEMLPVLKY